MKKNNLIDFQNLKAVDIYMTSNKLEDALTTHFWSEDEMVVNINKLIQESNITAQNTNPPEALLPLVLNRLRTDYETSDLDEDAEIMVDEYALYNNEDDGEDVVEVAEDYFYGDEWDPPGYDDTFNNNRAA